MVTEIDTLPLLQILAATPHEMLSRGELKRHGITDDEIQAAVDREEIVINSIDNTRDGEKSSLASILLTDTGSDMLDRAEEM